MEKEFLELKEKVEKLEKEIEKIKKILSNHRHDGHGYIMADE